MNIASEKVINRQNKELADLRRQLTASNNEIKRLKNGLTKLNGISMRLLAGERIV